ncbi:MAG: homoserine kinase, partial [Christiangramia sp.]|nr:homoserine kinase [Christiangramia sp.]
AINQWGNLGALVSALYTEDYELLGRSLKDEIVEPIRSILIPFFSELDDISKENGALGFGISGSGPSVYALCRGDENAKNVEAAIRKFYSTKEIEFDLHLSGINNSGVRIL